MRSESRENSKLLTVLPKEKKGKLETKIENGKRKLVCKTDGSGNRDSTVNNK